MNPQPKLASADPASLKRLSILRLLALTLTIAMIWTVLLPWLAGRPPIAHQLKWLDEQGIDPSAMYYTELEAMKPILQKLYERDMASR